MKLPLDAFANDSSSNKASDLCTKVLAQAVVARLAKVGGCKTVITNQLKTVTDFGMTIKSITVTGSKATAVVQTVKNRVKTLNTVTLDREAGAWRLASFV